MVQKASLQRLVWHRVSQGHQSHSWVFTVGRIKVLVLRLTLKDVGFTLGWWLWLSRLGPKWVDASHTQTLHCAHLHNVPVALSARIRFYDYIITIDWMQVVFISWVECVINMSALNTVSSGVLCKRYFYPSCKEEVSTSFGTLLSVVHPSTAGGSAGPSGVRLSEDISSDKIPLAGLKTSCSQRKLLHETVWAKKQPSFSDKGIQLGVCACMWNRSSATQGQPYSKAGWGRPSEGRGATIMHPDSMTIEQGP